MLASILITSALSFKVLGVPDTHTLSDRRQLEFP
jgi:hypothetical protein